MGILPDQLLWQSFRPNSPGKQLDANKTPRSNTSPQFSAASSGKPRGKRLVHDAAARQQEVCLGTESGVTTPRLRRGASEPSIATAEDLQVLPAAGCRQARISELRSERKLGRRKTVVEPAYVESVVTDKDRHHAHRFYKEPHQKRVGAKMDAEERHSKPRPCAEHRYYHELGQDHIEGLRNPGGAKGMRDTDMANVLCDHESVRSVPLVSQELCSDEPLRSSPKFCRKLLLWHAIEKKLAEQQQDQICTLCTFFGQ
eukprot:CAMPEP_0169292400 /NCGR_PEP_ID=MMETSP1016-20121227/62740_1 /TAXON_ID=342587 /ORGANISM="Karlodinium micrum, Strain CCMP2283" /LENGTH=256 /DNA_ID=CAMNT_0009383029 /DNA_START=13 /DNA_END=783 /DNA_ORIENTATION=+